MISKRSSTLLLLATAIAALLNPASAALNCSDLVLPTLGDDTNPGLIPAGPRLLSTGDAGSYNYVVNSASDALEFYVQSSPGVGTLTDFTRKINIALAGRDTVAYGSVSTNAGCAVAYTFFPLASPATGVTISTTATDLTNSATGDEAQCFFNSKLAISWADFRGTTLNTCGFTVSDNTSAPANGTYRTYSGRVFVAWADYANATDAGLLRSQMSTWYDVTIQIQTEANSTSASVGNTETPYNADFQVTGVTYNKASNGAVTANIAYELSTNFPYLPKMPAGSAYNYLLHSGSGAAATYAGLALGESGSASYPGGVWSNDFTLDGTVKSDTTACAAVGDVCVMRGALSYTWTPTPAISASCSIASNTAYQFAFVLDCDTTYNGTIGSSCGAAMKDALGLPNFGSFKFQGNVDFCKSAATDFPLTWSQTFDVESTSRQIGQTIKASGAFTSQKQLAGVAIKEYRVSRSDLTGFWSMWSAASDSATSSGAAGVATTVGSNTQFTTSIGSSNGAKNWAISTSFTPNIKMYSSVQSSFGTTDARGDYLISLPNDKGLSLSYQITLVVRLYSDSTQNFAGAKRRLLYRDTAVPVVKSAAAVDDLELKTHQVGVKIPDNVSVSKDGQVTVITGQQGLSVGVIAGIAAIGAVVAGAAIGMTVLIVRRRRQQREAAADAEKAASIPTIQIEGKPVYGKVVA